MRSDRKIPSKKMSIYELDLPTRLNNLLVYEEIDTVYKLVRFIPEDLEDIPNMGIKYIERLKLSLMRLGYRLSKYRGETK